MNIDFNSLTLDEVEIVENLCQKSIETLMDDGVPRGRALKALIFILMRRNNPDYTIEQAGKLSLAEAAALFESVNNPKG
jgi:hypothetical protein